MHTEELLDGAEPGLPEAIWKLTPVGRVPVCPLAVMTPYAVTCEHAKTHMQQCCGIVHRSQPTMMFTELLATS